MNTVAVAALEADLVTFWETLEVKNGWNARYGSWKPGRRNMPPSGKAWREFNARRQQIFGDFFAAREGQFVRLLTKLARNNGGLLTERAARIWRECRLNIGDYRIVDGLPVTPDFFVTRNAKPKPNDTTMPDVNLTPEIADILRRSIITATLIVLPEQLPPAVYKAVDKALKNAGGRWKRGKGHVFETGTQFLRSALETGVSKDRVKEYQFFPTPAALAHDLAGYAHIKPGDRVLEPSAGDGALIRAIVQHDPAEVYAVEIRSEAYNQLIGMALDPAHSTTQVRCHCGDFLALTPRDIGTFHAIVMNPPFTRDADLAHVHHAWQFLKPGGRLVALTSPSWTFSLNRKRREFAEFVQGVHGDYTRLAELEFGRTKIAPVLIMLDKAEASAAERAYTELMAV